MNTETQTWRSASLLPSPGRGGLVLMIASALTCFAAGVALVWLSADLHARRVLVDRLGDGLTIVVAPEDHASPLTSGSATAWRAAEVLASHGGPESVRVLDPAPMDAPIARTLGVRGRAARLIILSRKPKEPNPSPRQVSQWLRGQGFDAAVDDLALTTGPLGQSLTMVAARLVGLCVVALATLAALSALQVDRLTIRHHERLVLFGRLGMTDRVFLTQVVAPFGLISVAIGAVGTVLGALAAVAFGLRPPGLSALVAAPRPADLLLVCLWPPLALLVTIGAAVLAARGPMRRFIP